MYPLISNYPRALVVNVMKPNPANRCAATLANSADGQWASVSLDSGEWHKAKMAAPLDENGWIHRINSYSTNTILIRILFVLGGHIEHIYYKLNFYLELSATIQCPGSAHS